MKINASFMEKFHLGMIVVWLLLAIPSILWWKTSVLWVIILSLYANIVGHLSGYSGARAEKEAHNNNKE